MSEEKETFLGMEVGSICHLIFIICCIVGVISVATFAVVKDAERRNRTPTVVTLFSTTEGCTAYRYYDKQRGVYEYFMACKSGKYTLGSLNDH